MRKLLVLSAAFGLITMLPSIAPADPPPGSFTNAGAAKDSCEAAGGIFENLSTAFVTKWRCTIVTTDTETDTVPASHPTQAWTVDVEAETQRTEIYEINRSVGQSTWQTISDDTETLSEEVIACYNHRGNQVEDYQDNPNCQPAE